MEAGPEEEGDEVLDIPIPNTSADPRAMMVVHFDADAALAAVEGAGRAQVLAGVAVTHLIMSLPRLNKSVIKGVTPPNPLRMLTRRQILKLVQTVVLVNWIGKFYLLHRFVQLLPILVFNVIFFMYINLLYLNILYLRIHEHARHDAGLGEAYHEEGPQTQEQTYAVNYRKYVAGRQVKF